MSSGFTESSPEAQERELFKPMFHSFPITRMTPSAAFTLSGCIFIVFNQSCQPKVGNLAYEAVAHQDVCGPQVSVDVVHPLDVRHSRGHLPAAAKTNHAFKTNSTRTWAIKHAHLSAQCSGDRPGPPCPPNSVTSKLFLLHPLRNLANSLGMQR